MPNDRVLNFSEFADKYSQDTAQDSAASFSEFQNAANNFQEGFDDSSYGDGNEIKPNRPLNQGEGVTPQQPGDEFPGETEGMEAPTGEEEEETNFENTEGEGEESINEPEEEEMEGEEQEENETSEEEEEHEGEDDDFEDTGNPEDEDDESEEKEEGNEDEEEEDEEESNESKRNLYGKSEKILESFDDFVANGGVYDKIISGIQLDFEN